MNLNNEELHKKLINLSGQERVLISEILRHLKEVEKRRLYAQMAYSSLFEYCVKELKMSEGSTGRKIAAMRLIKEVPQMETSLKEGKVNLMTLSLAKQFFKQESYSDSKKLKLLKSLEGKSKREVEKKLISLNPSSTPSLQTKVKQLTPEHTRISISLNQEQKNKLDRLKELKGFNESQALEWMLDRVLKQIDPRQAKPRPKIKTGNTNPDKRHIPAALKQAVHIRDNGRCQYKDSKSTRQCESRLRLQIDHIKPMALGGRTEIHNLRLLCPEHNRMMAIKAFGTKKMNAYLRSTPPVE